RSSRNWSMSLHELTNLGGLFDLDAKKERIQGLEQEMTNTTFWDDQDKAQTVINESNALKHLVEAFEELEERHDNQEVPYELVKEENDAGLVAELDKEIGELSKDVSDFELEMLLSDPHDANNAILEPPPGAGVTESQGWDSRLLR